MTSGNVAKAPFQDALLVRVLRATTSIKRHFLGLLKRRKRCLIPFCCCFVFCSIKSLNLCMNKSGEHQGDREYSWGRSWDRLEGKARIRSSYWIGINRFWGVVGGETLLVRMPIVRPNSPPLSVLVRVMVLRITCTVCIKRMIFLHPKAFMSFWITLFISGRLLALGHVGLLKGPTDGLGNTSSQGYSPLAFDYPFLHLAIARVLHFLHCCISDWFFTKEDVSVKKHSLNG